MVYNILSLELFRRRGRVGRLAEAVKSQYIYIYITQYTYYYTPIVCGATPHTIRWRSFGGNTVVVLNSH